MVGARFRISALATLFLLAASAAQAADYTPPPPPPPPVYTPPPLQECCSNWYLRGDVGIGINGKYTLDYEQNPLNSSNFAFTHSDIDDSVFLGGGVGYYFNNWLRFDVTGEYRSKARVYAYGSYTSGGGTFLDTYQGNLSSWVFLANAYVDLGTWYCLTPFVGVGVGGAYNTLSDFTDIGVPTGGNGVGRNPSEWHGAYALYAGLAYNVSKNFKIELAYRYLNYGSITDTVDCVGGCNPDSYKFDKLHSNDIMLSLRWSCCEWQTPAPPPPPPQYVYTPPPVYTPPAYTPQPPLRSRG
jgi:opacity protein-like surface antigen